MTSPSLDEPPTPTLERIAAWQEYVNEYAVRTAQMWINDQGATREQVELGVCAILADFAVVDGEPWMSLRNAQHLLAGERFVGEGKELHGEARLRFVNALRTSVTSTEYDRIALVADSLGVDYEHAKRITSRVAASDSPSQTVSLYRYFDSRGELLYVGIAADPGARNDQHRRSSPWFRFVADRRVEVYVNRSAALEAESLAIKSERPIFNDAQNRANRHAALDYLFAQLESRTGEVA